LRRPALLGALLLFGFALADAAARAEQFGPGEVVLEDAIAVEVVGREVVAFDLQGSGQLALRLELDEKVVFRGARGRVGVVLTDRRMLAAAPGSASWQSERYRLGETPQESAWISQTLALVVTEQRVIAFLAVRPNAAGTWIDETIGPNERVVTTRIGPATAVVITDRRALGIGERGGFFATPMRLSEEIEGVEAISSIATVTTSQRTLVFKGPSGIWTERDRRLR